MEAGADDDDRRLGGEAVRLPPGEQVPVGQFLTYRQHILRTAFGELAGIPAARDHYIRLSREFLKKAPIRRIGDRTGNYAGVCMRRFQCDPAIEADDKVAIDESPRGIPERPQRLSQIKPL